MLSPGSTEVVRSLEKSKYRAFFREIEQVAHFQVGLHILEEDVVVGGKVTGLGQGLFQHRCQQIPLGLSAANVGVG